MGEERRQRGDVWNLFPELTPVLKAMLMLSENIEYTCLDVIERFVILLYDRISSLSKVNEVRQELFSRKAISLENIPLTQASLRQHVKRTVFQGGFVWGKPRTPAMSSFDLAVKLVAEDAANARKPI